MKIDFRHAAVRQFCRYLLVGVLNTLVTLVVIFILKAGYGVNQWVSNAIGYVAGLINSFIWNKLWVFHSHDKGRAGMAQAVKFGVGFLLCYGIQLFVTWFLTTPMDLVSWTWTFGGVTLSGYGLATLVGMGFYTVANFVFNRLVTFRIGEKPKRGSGGGRQK